MILPPEVVALIASVQGELEGLRAENAELRRRLGLDSSTSSKPPSSDGLRKKPVSLREPSGRPSGGQKGHKGETLRQVAEPDRIVTHAASACRHCGGALSPAMARGMERLEGGVVVHDGFKPYRNLDGAARPPADALCNAHHLRELKALVEFDNELWAAKMRDCLRDACQAVGEARAKGETALSPATL